MKKMLVLLLVMALVLCACGKSEAPALSGSGTAEDPYRIESAAQLQQMRRLVNDAQTNAAYGSAHYLLSEDIDLGGGQWEPIGKEYQPFRGVLDGQGHTIQGLRIRWRTPLSGEKQHAFGLFGTVYGAVIRNLTLNSSQISASGDGSHRVGGFVAEARDVILENLHVTNTVSLTSDYQAAGICVNLDGDSVLRGCTSAADISTTGAVSSASGIVVRADAPVESCVNIGPILSEGDAAGIASTANAGLTDCRNEGTITAAGGYASGIVCRFGDGALNHSENDDAVTLLRCVNTGDVLSASDPAGGIAVRCSTGHLAGCVNTGNVTSPMECGGIFAYFNQSVFGAPCALFTVTDCRNEGTITSTDEDWVYCAGGIGGILYDSSTEFRFENCVNTGDIFSGESAGGILGSSGAPKIHLLGCVNSGTVTGREVCGGIVGEASPHSEAEGEGLVFLAENCRNEGTVYVRRGAMHLAGNILLDSYAGGITGRCWNLPTEPAFTQIRFENCTNTGTLTGDDAHTHFYAQDLYNDLTVPEE